MLEFIQGRAGSGKTLACLTDIAEKIKQDPLGKPLLLLTPAHLTYKLECKLAELLKEKGAGFMRAQVLSFQRLAVKVLSETGGALYPRITAVGKRLLLKKILAQRSGELKLFSKAARQRGFASGIAELIEELKNHNITAQKLLEASEHIEDEQLKNKLLDVAQIYTDFSSSMTGRYNDAEDVLDTLIKKITVSKELCNAEIWLDGFSAFNPKEERIIEELMKKASCIHVAVLLDPENDIHNKSETGLFRSGFEITEQFLRLAKVQGKQVKVRKLNAPHRFKSPELEVVERELFTGTGKTYKCGENIKIIEASNRRRELEAVAADIIRLVREKGYRYKDIGILMRSDEEYGLLPELILKAYGIPFFSDFKREGTHHPLAELIRAAFDILKRRTHESVFRALKTGFFPLTREQIDILENYVLRFGIKDSRWTQEDDWDYLATAKKFEDEEATLSEEEQETEILVNLLRRKVTEPLKNFVERFKSAANVSEQTMAVYELFVELGVAEQLESMAFEAESKGMLADARMHRQLWDDMTELIEQIVTISGAEKMSGKEYETVFSEGLDALTVALIPPGLDYVTVSSFQRNSLMETKALYVIGANDGVLPKKSREKGLFSDADRLHLTECDIKLPQGSRNDSFREGNLIYRGFAVASEYLCFSYPLADSKGKGLKKSLLLMRLAGKIFTDLQADTIANEDFTESDNVSLLPPVKRRATAALCGVFRRYREKPSPLDFWADVYNAVNEEEELNPLLKILRQGLFFTKTQDELPTELAQKLYLKGERLKGSVSRFEVYRKCPFSHFLSYGLNLKEREVYKFAVKDHGTFLHAVMAKFGREMKKAGRRWSEVDEAECHTLCEKIVGELAPRFMNEILYSSEQRKNLLQRITKIAEEALNRLIAFDKASSFSPYLFEQPFGLGKEGKAPLRIRLSDGFMLEVRGVIDRIDKSEDGNYFLVIDYKTGKMELDLNEVYNGIKLQLLTYLLFVGESGEKAMPAGMLYCFLKSASLRGEAGKSEEEIRAEIDKLLRMPGWLLDDDEVLRLIDSEGTYIKLNKTGKNKNIKRSKEEFDALLAYTRWILSETGEQIIRGNIRVYPYSGKTSACTYCPHGAICRFDKATGEYEENKPEKLSDSEIFELMSEKGEEKA